MIVAERTWQDVALEMMREQSARPVVRKWSKRLGVSDKTIYRQARRHGYRSGKQVREDARQLPDDVQDHITSIAHIYLRRPAPGTESRMTIETAVDIYREHMAAKGTPVNLPSIARITQLLREHKLTRRDQRQPTPKLKMRSLYPNHVHQYDTSVCRYYLNPDQRIVPIGKAEDYKNKPGRFDKKQRLIRHILIDHATGAFYVEYSTTQRQTDDATFLYHGWKRKEDGFIFHGVPRMLILDNDNTIRSHAMMRLYNYLGIEIPDVIPYHSWVKGTVEEFNLCWERWFEMKFLFQKSGDLDEINRWAFNEAVRIQNTKIHSRHGMTRFAAWDAAVGEHLREIVDLDTYKQMLYSVPDTRKVRIDGSIFFKGQVYKVEDPELWGTRVDVIVHPFKYEDDMAITVQWPSRKEPVSMVVPDIKTYTLIPRKLQEFGFDQDAVVWGNYKAVAKTAREKALEGVESAGIQEEVLTPFLDSVTAEMKQRFPQRIGRPIEKAADIASGPVPMSRIKAKQALCKLMGRGLSNWEAAYVDDKLKGRTVFYSDVEELARFFEASGQTEMKKEA